MNSLSTVLLLLSLVVCAGLALRVRNLRREFHTLKRSFDTLVTEAPVGVIQTDANGRHILSNAAWTELSGLSTEVTAANWQQVIHPDDLPQVTARWEAAVRTQRAYTNQLRLVKPDGTEREVVAVIHPVQDDNEQAAGFIGVVLDVTELSEARRQVQEKDRLLQDVLDHSASAIYVKDREGRYLLANKRHIELWPSMSDFQPGATAYDWFSEEVARSFEASDRAVFESGEVHTFEEVIPHDGESSTFLSVKFPIRNDRGEITAVGGISTDVSAVEQAHRQLAEREKVLRNLIDLQEQERQLICHEFHDGLIQYVVGATMLLERLLEEPQLPEHCFSTLESVSRCLSKGLEDARRVIRGIRPASLDDLGLQAAVDDLVGELEADGVTVEMHIEGTIDGIDDELQTTVYRVFQELFNNIAKHSNASRVVCSLKVDADNVRLAVQDFGCGFDPAVPTRGFGLTGIRERVRLAGGDYELRAAPGEGTQVQVRLPCARQTTGAAAAPVTPANGMS